MEPLENDRSKKTKKEEGKFVQLTPLPFGVEDENFRKLFAFILTCYWRKELPLTGITSGREIFASCLCTCERIYLNNSDFHRQLKEAEGILHASHILNTSQIHQKTMSGGIGIYAAKKRKKPVQKM